MTLTSRANVAGEAAAGEGVEVAVAVCLEERDERARPVPRDLLCRETWARVTPD